MNIAYFNDAAEKPPPAGTDAEFPELSLYRKGRNKDLYDFGEILLMVATDRNVDEQGREFAIPGKGQAMNQLSAYWFKKLRELFPNHFLTVETHDFPKACRTYAEQLAGRAMLVRKATPLPVNCRVRGYLTGSGWQEYQNSGMLAGIKLPAGMVESQRLPAPLFIPSLKGDAQGTGDEALEAACGRMLAEKMRNAALKLFFNAWKLARNRGILIVETTFEFGICEGRLLLIDECLTPATSRFWPLETYKSGGPLPFLGVNDLPNLREETPRTGISSELRKAIGASYQSLFKQLTGQRL